MMMMVMMMTLLLETVGLHRACGSYRCSRQWCARSAPAKAVGL